MFFSPVLKVYFYRSPKKFAFKVFNGIPLKHIDSNLAIVFVSHDDLQNR